MTVAASHLGHVTISYHNRPSSETGPNSPVKSKSWNGKHRGHGHASLTRQSKCSRRRQTRNRSSPSGHSTGPGISVGASLLGFASTRCGEPMGRSRPLRLSPASGNQKSYRKAWSRTCPKRHLPIYGLSRRPEPLPKLAQRKEHGERWQTRDRRPADQ